MKNILLLLIVFSASTIFAEEPKKLVIFHTNDIHGHFVSEPATWRKDHASVGGFSALSGYLTKLRSENPNSIYLDAGDLMTGNPICNIEYHGTMGGALLEFLNRVNLDAMCLGNHDLDLGADHLREFLNASPVKILNANLVEKTNNELVATPTAVFEKNGIRIGVIGLILDNLQSVLAKKSIEPFEVKSTVVTAQKYIDELDPLTDLIILLNHNGIESDRELAHSIHGADIIVGGHSHTRLEKPEVVNGVIVVQAGSYLQNLGMLEISVAGDSVQSYNGKLIELLADSTHPDSSVAFLADSLNSVIQTLYGQTIGTLTEKWQRSYYEGSNVGNWICDQLRNRYQTDIAVVNSGGIRADLNAGPITKLDILELLPFQNSTVTFIANGKDLLKFAAEQAHAQGQHDHGALEMSGMTIQYSKSKKGVKVTSVKINGKKVDENKKYSVSTIDYVSVSQAERYLGFIPQEQNFIGDLLSDVIIDEIQKIKEPIKSDKTTRLEQIR